MEQFLSRKKRVQSVLIISLLLFGLSACGSQESSKKNDSKKEYFTEMSKSKTPTEQLCRKGAPKKKHALLVGISEYDSSTDWERLNSVNDIAQIRKALHRQGFKYSDIHELSDGMATKQNIVKVFREELIEGSCPGDVVVFHFSGHGQQITDAGERKDEIDGYDEALVPYDAPQNSQDGYQGDKHLRDDTVNDLLWDVRERGWTFRKRHSIP